MGLFGTRLGMPLGDTTGSDLQNDGPGGLANGVPVDGGRHAHRRCDFRRRGRSKGPTVTSKKKLFRPFVMGTQTELGPQAIALIHELAIALIRELAKQEAERSYTGEIDLLPRGGGPMRVCPATRPRHRRYARAGRPDPGGCA